MWKNGLRVLTKKNNGIKALPAPEFSLKVEEFKANVQNSIAHLPARALAEDENSLKVISDLEKSKVLEFIVEHDKQNLCFSSPISGGLNKYGYNSETRQWECRQDGHDLVGIFTRDFIKISTGVPIF